MSVITEKFSRLREKKQGALIPFLTLGYPSIDETCDLVMAMAEGGADLIELGVPFSDPVADGKTIQHCSQVALKNGMTLNKGLELVSELRRRGLDIPLILMGYVNPFLAYGIEKLAADAKKAGVNGLIVPDLPPHEAELWKTAFSKEGIDIIFFLASTTSPERMSRIVDSSSGFIYCLSVAGVTGAREALASDLKGFLEKVKAITDKPLAVGFGLSKAEQIKEVIKMADGAIVASALLQGLANCAKEERASYLKNFVHGLKEATLGYTGTR
ncbi:MAG: tryptophan synthase subunit alpha [Oligoflexales bacterium]